MRDMFVRNPFNYDMDAVSRETGVDFSNEESVTQQQFAEDADINVIVRRFGLTGEVPEDFRTPKYGDFTHVSDFQTALNTVKEAEEEFMRLPAEVRARFQNNPQELLTFVENKDNRDEAIKLGLIPKPPEKTRDMVQAVDELTAHFKGAKVPPL